MRDLDVPPPNLSVVSGKAECGCLTVFRLGCACWRWRRHDMALISSEKNNKKSSRPRSRFAIKIFLCKLMKAEGTGVGAAAGARVAGAEGQQL